MFELGNNTLTVDLADLSDEARELVIMDFNPSQHINIALSKALCVGPAELGVRLMKEGGSCSSVTAHSALLALEHAQMLLTKAAAQKMNGK